ncbi:MAG: lysophospholipid acyltransferase family protein, partial [Rikenellaceae bacterium]
NIILMNINTNVKESMQQMYRVLGKGHNIVIFPEGTRSKSGEMKEFKESFAILAKALNIPIVTVAISGSEAVTYDSVGLPRLGAEITVDYLPTMEIGEEESCREFAQRVAKRIELKLKV